MELSNDDPITHYTLVTQWAINQNANFNPLKGRPNLIIRGPVLCSDTVTTSPPPPAAAANLILGRGTQSRRGPKFLISYFSKDFNRTGK